MLNRKAEQGSSQLEHIQPMEQTRSLFCTCYLGVARCQSQQQCHLWQCVRCSKRIASANKLGSCQSILCNSWGYERLQKSKDSLKDCFENVNIHKLLSYNPAPTWICILPFEKKSFSYREIMYLCMYSKEAIIILLCLMPNKIMLCYVMLYKWLWFRWDNKPPCSEYIWGKVASITILMIVYSTTKETHPSLFGAIMEK